MDWFFIIIFSGLLAFLVGFVLTIFTTDGMSEQRKNCVLLVSSFITWLCLGSIFYCIERSDLTKREQFADYANQLYSEELDLVPLNSWDELMTKMGVNEETRELRSVSVVPTSGWQYLAETNHAMCGDDNDVHNFCVLIRYEKPGGERGYLAIPYDRLSIQTDGQVEPANVKFQFRAPPECPEPCIPEAPDLQWLIDNALNTATIRCPPGQCSFGN